MIRIRPERPEDAWAAANVHVAAWRVAYAEIIPEEVLDALDPGEMAERRKDRPGQCLVAEKDGAVVGFISFGPGREDPHLSEVYAIYVHPDHWGTGVADALMSHAAGLMHNDICLWVLAGNQRAQRFYERYGLRRDGQARPFRPRGSELTFPMVRMVSHRGGDEEERQH